MFLIPSSWSFSVYIRCTLGGTLVLVFQCWMAGEFTWPRFSNPTPPNPQTPEGTLCPCHFLFISFLHWLPTKLPMDWHSNPPPTSSAQHQQICPKHKRTCVILHTQPQVSIMWCYLNHVHIVPLWCVICHITTQTNKPSRPCHMQADMTVWEPPCYPKTINFNCVVTITVSIGSRKQREEQIDDQVI